MVTYARGQSVWLLISPDKFSKFYNKNKLSACFEGEIFGDILDFCKFQKFVSKVRPDIVYHLAAQSLVLEGYNNPLETFKTNIFGVVTVLEAFRKVDHKVIFVNVTSDKCYKNKETAKPYDEQDPLGGSDPYSASKACSELISACYANSYFDKSPVRLATVRAGNVIGGGDLSENRLIPDLLRAYDNSEQIIIRYPDAIRPWQHVLDALSGYIRLAEKMFENPDKFNSAWNFGPGAIGITVRELVEIFVKLTGGLEISMEDSYAVIEAKHLSLDIKKAQKLLDWRPRLSIETALEMTLAWHEESKAQSSMIDFSSSQILGY